jgi:RHS repeat-associated protein
MNVRSRYYYAGSTRVAMCTGTNPFTLNFLLGDHLGSNAITTSNSGVRSTEIRYMPWGTTRYTYGSNPTTFQYTGQRVESSLGLLFYNARWYDSALGRFIQADSIVPGGVQGLDRYAYVSNNPLKYTDPTGRDECDEDGNCHGPQGTYQGIKSGLPPSKPTLTTNHAKYSGTKPYSGSEVLQLFYLMQSYKDGWWYADGDFTFTDFCGLLLMHEGAGNPTYMNLDAIAANQQLYIGSWNGPYNLDGFSLYGTCNYWAAFSQSAHNLIDLYVRGDKPISEYSGYGDRGLKNPDIVMNQANQYGGIMLNSKPNSDRYNALSDYGNDQTITNMLNMNGMLADTYYPGGNNGIYYCTISGAYWYSVNGFNQLNLTVDY